MECGGEGVERAYTKAGTLDYLARWPGGAGHPPSPLSIYVCVTSRSPP